MTPAQLKIRSWRENPVKFVWDNFRVKPDAWQEDALWSFVDPKPRKRISLQACAGPGKSALLAWVGWLFLSCYADKGYHPKGAAVSESKDNLKDNLWAEFAHWRGLSPFLSEAFVWTKERIFAKDHPETWFISARSWSKSATAEEQGRALSGLHARFVLCLVDESGAIPLAVLTRGEQALSSESTKWGRIVQAGNPTSHDGMLYMAATTLRDQWDVIRITGDPSDPKRSPRINIEWAAQQIKTYGLNNPWVMAYILGQFPPSALNKLLGPEEVEAAMARHYHETDYSGSQKRLGIDVARFGNDRTIIFPRQGLVAFNPAEMRNARSHEIAARVALAKSRWGSEMEFIDDTGGWASGVIDSLLQAEIVATPINFSGSAPDSRYFNIRTWMWWQMAEWVKRGGALPRRPQLVKELTAPTYYFHNGKLRLEEKEQIKTRLHFSPDEADALGLTFAYPEMPAALPYPLQQDKERLRSEWNPHDSERT